MRSADLTVGDATAIMLKSWWRRPGRASFVEPQHRATAMFGPRRTGNPLQQTLHQADEGGLMGFRLFPRFHPRHQLRRTFRAGPVRLNVGPDGVSWGLGAGRWSWNAKSRRHTVDTPGPGFWESRGRRPRP